VPSKSSGSLPANVETIPYSGVHSVATCRNILICRVARQEDTAAGGSVPIDQEDIVSPDARDKDLVYSILNGLKSPPRVL
jgi:hypothetical protein